MRSCASKSHIALYTRNSNPDCVRQKGGEDALCQLVQFSGQDKGFVLLLEDLHLVYIKTYILPMKTDSLE